MNALQTFSYQGNPVEFEVIGHEVYANATGMCRVFDKRPADWMRLPVTIRYAEAIKAKCENLTSLTISRKGGVDGGGSTWIHEKLILKLAQWLDVEFEIWCDEQVAKLLKLDQPQQPAPYYLPQTKAEALRALAEEIEQHEATQLQLEAAKPKVEQYERTMNADGSFTIAEVAKMIGTGQNRLFDFLREHHILFVHRGHNQPYQQHVDNGLFWIRQKTFRRGDKEESYPQLFVTPRGVEAIRKKYDSLNRIPSTASL